MKREIQEVLQPCKPTIADTVHALRKRNKLSYGLCEIRRLEEPRQEDGETEITSRCFLGEETLNADGVLYGAVQGKGEAGGFATEDGCVDTGTGRGCLCTHVNWVQNSPDPNLRGDII